MSYQAHRALARIDLFAGLPDTALRELIEHGTTFTTPPGTPVVQEGSADAGLEVVLDGTADITVNGVRRSALRPGDYFGEISMIDGAPRSATVVAGPDGLTTFRLSALAFSPVIDNPKVSRVLLKALCGRIRALEAKTSDNDDGQIL